MDVTQAQEPFQWRNIRYQYYATFAANLIALSQGCNLGWISPSLHTLASNDTPLSSGPLTTEQTSWIGSISCIGGLIGSLSFGYFTVRMGSKRVVLFLAFPVVVFWSLIYFGTTYYHILIARFIAGWAGGGVQSTVVLYISEISSDNIRGQLGSVTCFLRHIGILFEYILGATVEYQYIPIISVIIPITFFITFSMIPNTPRFYLHRGQIQKAEESLILYKGCNEKDQHEYNAICKELERMQVIMNEQKHNDKFRFADFWERSALKGLCIGIILTTFASFSANLPLTSYAVMTFEKIGTAIDPFIASIMVAVALVFGSLASTYLADKLGRKKLNLISLMGSACGLLITAIYYYFSINGCSLSTYAWVPIASLSFVIFISSAGIVPLSIICSVEYLPTKVRTYGMAIISCSYSFLNFVCVKIYPLLFESVDLHGCLIIFSIGCFIGFAYVLFVLEETSGQSLDDVGVDEKTKSQRIQNERLVSF